MKKGYNTKINQVREKLMTEKKFYWKKIDEQKVKERNITTKKLN